MQIKAFDIKTIGYDFCTLFGICSFIVKKSNTPLHGLLFVTAYVFSTKEEQGNSMKEEYQEEHFETFLKKLRNTYGEGIVFPERLTAKSLCEGLCTTRMLQYLEKREKMSDKFLQDRLLERLGISADEYEPMQGYERYDRWKARMRILHSITWGRMQEAIERLEEYRKRAGQSKVERQFCLAMEAQIKFCLAMEKRKCTKKDREELGELYKEAVELTMPGLAMPKAESKPLREMVLAPIELNLLLEAEQYREEGERPERYAEVIEYLEKSRWDKLNLAMVYPKAVYFLCSSVMALKSAGQECRWEEQELLQYCDRALEYLIDSERMYYLWEILDMRGRLLDGIAGELVRQRKNGDAEKLQRMYREDAEWKQALQSIYQEYGIPKETLAYCYLYVEKGVFCFNDVIRIRRLMLGMTEEELCDGICEIRTLKRLERRKTVTQRAIVEELLMRLGLPWEFMRTELLTSSPEARRLMRKLKYEVWRDDWKKVDELLAQIKELVNMDIPWNRQTVMQCEVLSFRHQGLLTDEEYRQKMREVLEITLPFEAFLKEGEKYLTYEEQVCIQNMMLVMDKESEEYLTCMIRFEEMYQPFIDQELQETVAGIYEMVMGNVGSDWGNRGEYDRSDMYSEHIIEGCLKFQRMASLPGGLYGRWWNYVERKKKGIRTERDMDNRAELERCILFSQLSKQLGRAHRYQKKLNQLLTKDDIK